MNTLKQTALLTLGCIAWGVLIYALCAFIKFDLSPLTWGNMAFAISLGATLTISLLCHIFFIINSIDSNDSSQELGCKLILAPLSFILLESACFSLYFWSINLTDWGLCRDLYYLSLSPFICISVGGGLRIGSRKALPLILVGLFLFVYYYLLFGNYLSSWNISTWGYYARFLYLGGALVGFFICLIVRDFCIEEEASFIGSAEEQYNRNE